MANNENILHLPTDDTIANGFNAIVEALEANPGTTIFAGEVQDDDSVALEATYGELYEAAQKGNVVIKVYANDEVVGSSAVLAAVKQPNALVPRDDLIQVSLGYRLPPYILDCAGTPDETVSIPSAEVFEIQPKLTFDITPTANSTNPVTSGGVKEYVDNKTLILQGTFSNGAVTVNGAQDLVDAYLLGKRIIIKATVPTETDTVDIAVSVLEAGQGIGENTHFNFATICVPNMGGSGAKFVHSDINALETDSFVFNLV